MRSLFMNHEGARRIGVCWLLLPALWLAETALLVFVNCLPDRFVKSHIASGIWTLAEEGTYPHLFFTPQSTLDNFTDAIMLQESQRTSEWNDVISKYTTHTTYLIDNPASIHNPLYAAFANQGYPRYWHGYTVITKPLLMVFGYSSIRMLSLFAILSLVCLSFNSIRRQFGVWAAASLIVGYMAISVPVTPMSLIFSPVAYTTLISLVFIRVFENPVHRISLFVAIGSLICYLDLLSMPLVTLAFPLLFCVLYDIRSQCSLPRMLAGVVTSSCAWAMSYASTWMLKWVLSTIVLRRNVLENAYLNVLRRSGSELSGHAYTKWDTISINLRTAFDSPMKAFYLTFFSVLILTLIIRGLVVASKRREHVSGIVSRTVGIIPLALVGVYPLLWYIVIQNHSQEHHILFGFKNTSILILAVALIILQIGNAISTKKDTRCPYSFGPIQTARGADQ